MAMAADRGASRVRERQVFGSKPDYCEIDPPVTRSDALPTPRATSQEV